MGGGAAWSALAYALGRRHGRSDVPHPSREEAVAQIEQMLERLPEPRQQTRWLRWHDRAVQLRRIVMLERLIVDHLPKTPSGVSVLTPEQQSEVTKFVDKAIELAGYRVLLLRALQANPVDQALRELDQMAASRRDAGDRVREELEALITLKQEQVQQIKRWQEDLRLADIGLDQIETFLRMLAYDPAFTPIRVNEEIAGLKRHVEARKASIEEVEQRLRLPSSA
jgi:hypothetical protein